MDIYNQNHFLELVDELKRMEALFKKIIDKGVVRNISKHDVLVRGELNDLDIIWRRFLRDRQELIDLAPKMEKYFDNQEDLNSAGARKVFEREAKLANSLKVDLKSLFLFTDIMLNKLTLLIRSVVNQRRGIGYRSFTSFLKSIRKLEGKDSEYAWEHGFYQEHGEELERIDVLLGFYRDKFIVHVSGPYQEGIVRSLYFPEIRLDHTSWKLKEFDLNKFLELIGEIGNVIPEKDKYGNRLKSPGDPRPKVDALFVNLHRIKDPKLRERAEGYIRSVGLSTPDIYYLIKTIKDTTGGVIRSLANWIEHQYVLKENI